MCRRAFVRFMEKTVVGTYFLLGILRDLSEGKRAGLRIFFGCQGLPAVSGSSSCPRLQVPVPGLMRSACTDGEDRFGVKSPATGSNLESPVRSRPRLGGRILRNVVRPDSYSPRDGRQVATGGFRALRAPRQPERACSGSSG